MRVFCFLIFFSLSCYGNKGELTIRVCFKEAKLTVYGKERAIQVFRVALPLAPLKLPTKGEITKIELNANWYPTGPTRRAYLKKTGVELPKIIPPGHKLNAIGIGKMRINWQSGDVNPLIMIHGTNEPSSIGKKTTRGCIRLKNEDFLQLVEIVKNHKIFVAFE